MSVTWTDNLDRDMNNLSITTSNVSDKIHDRIFQLNAQMDVFKEKFPVLQKFPTKVSLDIGGEIFTSSVEVLTREPSFFSSMFSGRVIVVPDPLDNTYFIDRSPLCFPKILEYLRHGEIKNLKKIDKMEKILLLKEAEFYGIEGLLDLLGGKKKASISGSFEYESDWDGNGLFSWFKENEEKLPIFDLVAVSGGSSNNTYIIENSGGCTYDVSQDKALEICGVSVDWTLVSPVSSHNNYFVIDLGEDTAFCVTDTVFSCKYSPTSYFSTNVRLYGSEDKTIWKLISEVQLGHTVIQNNTSYYRYFKLDNESSQTLVSGWEMYGELE